MFDELPALPVSRVLLAFGGNGLTKMSIEPMCYGFSHDVST